MGVVSYAYEVTNDTVNEMVHKKAVELLEKGYGEFYNNYGSKANLCCKHESDNMIEEHFLLEIDVMLKAGSVQELDYYQGIMDYKTDRLAVLNNPSSNSISSDLINNTEYFSLLSNEVSSIYDNFYQYINKVQQMNFYVKATYEKDNYDSITIMYENGMDYVMAEEIYPSSREELKQNGYNRMAFLDGMIIKKVENYMESGETTQSSFSLVQAIGYSGRYSSNPTSCNVCESSCGAFVNTEVYNPSYKHYVGKNDEGIMRHADCATLFRKFYMLVVYQQVVLGKQVQEAGLVLLN